MKILGIPGSLRKDSFNHALLVAAKELAPAGVEIEIYEDLAEIPPFNQDQEAHAPAAVQALKEKIRSADAILFSSPEYNYSIPGVLKNAIDWCSRPYGDSAWQGKPAALMGASIGAIGTSRMQYHLRQVMVFLDMHPLNRPEIMVGPTASSFDASGKLVNEKSREMIASMLSALKAWSERLSA